MLRALYELWRTDGTAGGTLLLKPGLVYSASPLTAMGNNVYFAAKENGDAYGTELWESNGTVAGTIRLKDIFTGSGSSVPHDLYAFNGTLYFGAYDGTEPGLWKSDGTALGTQKIIAVYPTSFQASHNIVYFAGISSSYGSEIWKTDGTSAGTKQLKDIASGMTSSSPGNLTDVNGILFFTVNFGTTGPELWKTSGTTATTVLVKEIPVGSTNFLNGFTAAASKLFFLCFDNSLNEYALWVSNGTDSGTHTVADDGLNGVSLSQLKGNGNQLYLVGSNDSFGAELYVGDASVISSLKRINTVTKGIAINGLSAKLTANSFGNQLGINISSADKQKAKLLVSDASGNVYYTNVFDLQTRNANCKINTAAWPNGVYIIKLSDEQGQSNIVTLKAMK